MSPLLPTLTVTVLSTPKVVDPSTVAVTRAVFCPPSSATLFCTLSLPVSASTDNVIAVGVASSSVIVPVAVSSSPRVALVASDNSTKNVSAGSSITSSDVATVTVVEVDPAEMVTSVAVTAV